MSTERLKVVRFITDRIDHRGLHPKGREGVTKWDAAYADRACGGNTRTMWRDYHRALRAIAGMADAPRRDSGPSGSLTYPAATSFSSWGGRRFANGSPPREVLSVSCCL
jgi:hypothetical protein